MKKTRMEKLIIIFLCAIATITVITIKAINKGREAPETDTKVSIGLPEEGTLQDELSPYLDPDQLQKMDTSLYDEDAADIYRADME